MRDQYTGDVTDFLKFALLRAVVPPRSKLGVAWYYLEGHDGRLDGRHIEYLDEFKWLSLDKELLGELAKARQERSVATLQELRIWRSQTCFHRESVPFALERREWAERMVQCLNGCDVVFVDPDNGLSRHGIISRKSATVDEIEHLSRDGRAVILIRFPSRRGSHVEQLELHHRVLAPYGPKTIRTCVQVRGKNGNPFPRIRWFTLLNAQEEMVAAAEAFVGRLGSISGVKATMSEGASW